MFAWLSAPLLLAVDPPPASPPPSVAALTTALQAQAGLFSLCRSLNPASGEPRAVWLTLEVAPSGALLSHPGLLLPDPKQESSELDTCVARQATALSFPAQERETPLYVTYELRFARGEDTPTVAWTPLPSLGAGSTPPTP